MQSQAARRRISFSKGSLKGVGCECNNIALLPLQAVARPGGGSDHTRGKDVLLRSSAEAEGARWSNENTRNSKPMRGSVISGVT